MQVTCSHCGARYAVDPTAIGPTGRTVQCVRCSHRWFEKISAPPAAPAEPAPREPTVPDFVIRPTTHETGHGAGLPALTEPRSQSHWGRWLTATVLLVVVLAGATFAFRNEIRGRLPPEWRTLFTLDGVRTLFAPLAKATRPALPDRARLEIDIAASKVELADGRYVVRGEVVNTGRAPGSITTLKLVFRKGDDVLGERAYSLVGGPIAPGARLSFSQPLDDPPSGTTDVVPAVE